MVISATLAFLVLVLSLLHFSGGLDKDYFLWRLYNRGYNLWSYPTYRVVWKGDGRRVVIFNKKLEEVSGLLFPLLNAIVVFAICIGIFSLAVHLPENSKAHIFAEKTNTALSVGIFVFFEKLVETTIWIFVNLFPTFKTPT